MTVGERIKARRIELGISQEELAKKMGYSGKSSISKAETYGNNITTSKIRKFAVALDVSESYLMGWTDEDKDEQLSTAMLQGQRSGRLLASISKKLLDNDVDYIIKLMELSPDQKEIVFNQIDFLHKKQSGHK